MRTADKVLYMTYTAMMLALCALFQSLRMFFPALASIGFGSFNLAQLLTGSLVNLVLIVTAWNIGLWSCVAVSTLAAGLAYFMGQMPLPHMVVVVALGNLAISLLCWAFQGRGARRVTGVILGALMKFLVMAALVLYVVIPYFVPGGSPLVNALTAAFVWPQLVTAAIGGAIALLLQPRLTRGRGRGRGNA